MCTSVPHTPARRTRIRTSSSRMRGFGTSLSTNPGPADSFTSAFTVGTLADQTGGKIKHRPSARVATERQLDDAPDECIVLQPVLRGGASELRVLLEVAVRVHLD